jgi:hypothetical protein
MSQSLVISTKEIESKIYYIRSLKVMLDSDLAELYGVETRILNQAVTRNADRFPEDFMFQLTEKEWGNLKSQNVVLTGWGGRRKLPNVFTEHGILMLSSVLNSERAIKVNIQIMRVYVRIRELMMAHKDIINRLDKVERKQDDQDNSIMLIFEYLKQFEESKQQQLEQAHRKKLGYTLPDKKQH